MIFTDRDLLKSLELKVGDKFTIPKWGEFKVVKNSKTNKIEAESESGGVFFLGEFINIEIKKNERRIWTLDTIKIGDRYYVYDTVKEVSSYTYFATWMDDKSIRNGIAFTEKKYVEEYVVELKKFNEKYRNPQVEVLCIEDFTNHYDRNIKKGERAIVKKEEIFYHGSFLCDLESSSGKKYFRQL